MRMERVVLVKKKRWMACIGASALLIILLLSGLGVNAYPELETAQHVDLERYLGQWYAVAEIPQWFNRRCVGTKAHYSLADDGSIMVVNSCRRGSLDGRERTIQARAEVVDETTNARLEVTFFFFIKGDYWILEVGDDYQYAVVGEPQRENLWILSREKELDEVLYQEILQRVEAQGFNISKLRKPWEEE